MFLPVLLSLAGPGPEVGIPRGSRGSELVLTGRWMKLRTLLLINFTIVIMSSPEANLECCFLLVSFIP